MFKEKYILTASWETCTLQQVVVRRWGCELCHKMSEIYTERDSLGWTNAYLCPRHVVGSAFTTTFGNEQVYRLISQEFCHASFHPSSPSAENQYRIHQQVFWAKCFGTCSVVLRLYFILYPSNPAAGISYNCSLKDTLYVFLLICVSETMEQNCTKWKNTPSIIQSCGGPKMKTWQ